jgi:VanZ family protein
VSHRRRTTPCRQPHPTPLAHFRPARKRIAHVIAWVIGVAIFLTLDQQGLGIVSIIAAVVVVALCYGVIDVFTNDPTDAR